MEKPRPTGQREIPDKFKKMFEDSERDTRLKVERLGYLEV